MASKKVGTKKVDKLRPASTPEARENQLISLAIDLAEQQLRDGTASSQVITHFLKAGSTKERLERERLEEENKMLRAKTEELKSRGNVEELYQKAIAAFTKYSGKYTEEGEDDPNI